MSLVEPQANARDVHHAEVVLAPLVVARGDRSEALERMEAALDLVTVAVEFSVQACSAALAIRMAADDRLHPPGADLPTEFGGIVARVSKQRLAASVLKQLVGSGHFVSVARRERDVERPTFAVDDDVEFRGESAARVTKSVTFDPPFPPDAS